LWGFILTEVSPSTLSYKSLGEQRNVEMNSYLTPHFYIYDENKRTEGKNKNMDKKR